MRETCEGCIYYRPLAHMDADRVCHFMIDTGEKRGCPAAECTRYRKEKEHGLRTKGSPPFTGGRDDEPSVV